MSRIIYKIRDKIMVYGLGAQVLSFIPLF